MKENVFGKSDGPKGNTPVKTIKLNKKHSGKKSETKGWSTGR